MAAVHADVAVGRLGPAAADRVDRDVHVGPRVGRALPDPQRLGAVRVGGGVRLHELALAAGRRKLFGVCFRGFGQDSRTRERGPRRKDRVRSQDSTLRCGERSVCDLARAPRRCADCPLSDAAAAAAAARRHTRCSPPQPPCSSPMSRNWSSPHGSCIACAAAMGAWPSSVYAPVVARGSSSPAAAAATATAHSSNAAAARHPWTGVLRPMLFRI